MSTAMKFLLAGIAGLFLVVIIFAFVLFGFYNTCVRMENGLVAQYDQDKNNYSNYFSTLKEMAQVPSMYTDDLKKVYDGAIQSRYGADGSKALVQFIKEHNPNFDSKMYERIQLQIQSGRQSFEADQKSLIARQQAYRDQYETGMGAMFSGFFGFPTDKIKNIGIVTNEETEQAFTTKKAAPIQLR